MLRNLNELVERSSKSETFGAIDSSTHLGVCRRLPPWLAARASCSWQLRRTGHALTGTDTRADTTTIRSEKCALTHAMPTTVRLNISITDQVFQSRDERVVNSADTAPRRACVSVAFVDSTRNEAVGRGHKQL